MSNLPFRRRVRFLLTAGLIGFWYPLLLGIPAPFDLSGVVAGGFVGAAAMVTIRSPKSRREFWWSLLVEMVILGGLALVYLFGFACDPRFAAACP